MFHIYWVASWPGTGWSWSPLHWCSYQRGDETHQLLIQPACLFLFLLSAYWRASSGKGTEARVYIKAVCWCQTCEAQESWRTWARRHFTVKGIQRIIRRQLIGLCWTSLLLFLSICRQADKLAAVSRDFASPVSSWLASTSLWGEIQ